MENNKGVSKGTKIYFILSIIVVFFLNLHVIIKSPILTAKIGGCLGIVSCVIAMIYATKGFSKDAAKFHKLFMALVFLTFQLSACTVGINTNGAAAGVFVGFHCLAASFVLVLMLSRDLGKKLSMTFCWSIVAITLAMGICVLILYPGIFQGGTPEGTVASFRAGSNFCMSQIVLSMTIAKYQDKAARGRKI